MCFLTVTSNPSILLALITFPAALSPGTKFLTPKTMKLPIKILFQNHLQFYTINAAVEDLTMLMISSIGNENPLGWFSLRPTTDQYRAGVSF